MGMFRIPAEWELHEATWLAWPSNTNTWTNEELIQVRLEFIAFIAQIVKGEKVFLLIQSLTDRAGIIELFDQLNVQKEDIHFIQYSFNDSWIRDFGPDFLIGSSLKILDWRYNSWGGKYPPFDGDDQFCEWIAAHQGFESEHIDFVLEGGSVEFNGIGDLMTTESCLLNKNRNPDFSKRDIENLLKEKYNIENVIWLKKGLTGDDTDGHIDDMFRFISPSKVVGVTVEKKSHPDFETIQENRRILQSSKLSDGSSIELIDLPQAPVLHYKGAPLPTSYANFYISNYGVLVPQFGVENDAKAIDVLSRCFKDRKVIGLSSKNIIIGLGSFHCLSKHQPKF